MMEMTSRTRMPGDSLLTVTDWQKELCAGQEVLFLCIYYNHFGFGMSLPQVEETADKLEALMSRGKMPAPEGEIQVDRSGAEDGCIMIAFRPAANHASRYFDFPEDVARNLLARFRERLTTIERDERRCVSTKGQPT
jgi:hypothetical protein